MGQGIYDGDANFSVISLAFLNKRGGTVLPLWLEKLQGGGGLLHTRT
jgi:hypothetical protein